MRENGLKVSLTGIKPTGEPHLGNYIGAIKPALELTSEYDSVYFIADYHALNSIQNPDLLRYYTRSVAATWIACGLDPDRTLMYRQSDVPEIFELTTALSTMTGKGFMNRAHAYKAARDRNREAGLDDLDSGVNMGLYNYPILMAADILIMDSDVVPVGKDQLQHVEIAADIAGSFNHQYGTQAFTLTLPTAITPQNATATTLPGLDGRKMSKSYANTIPLFVAEADLRKLVRSIGAHAPVETPTAPENTVAFTFIEIFATPEVAANVGDRLKSGSIGWDEAKDVLFEVLNERITPMRQRYDALMAPGGELDDILAAGAAKARERAQPLVAGVRAAVGL